MNGYIVTGVYMDNNFGCPSLLLGLHTILQQIHGDDFWIILVDKSGVVNSDIDSLLINYNVTRIMHNSRGCQIIFNYFKSRYTMKFKRKSSEDELLKHIKESVALIELSGIIFCDEFSTLGKVTRVLPGRLLAWRRLLNNFPYALIAKNEKKRVIKSTSSIGPAQQSVNIESIKISGKHIFTHMIAREKSGKKLLDQYANNSEKFHTSDVGLCFHKPQRAPVIIEKTVCICPSFRMMSRTVGTLTYVEFLVDLIKYIHQRFGMRIILLPNECHTFVSYNDLDLAIELSGMLDCQGVPNEVFEWGAGAVTRIKSSISNCQFLITSRYHACVAAVESGVPTITIGWHEKYNELMQRAGMDEYIVKSDTTLSEAQTMCEKIINQRSTLRDMILLKRDKMQKEIIRTYEKILR